MTPIIISTTTLLIMLWLLHSLLKFLSPDHQPSTTHMKNTTKKAFFTSLIPTTLLLKNEINSSLKFPSHISLETFNIYVNFSLDTYSIMFSSIALFITWSIMEFSTWYLSNDPNINKFMKYLMIFLLSMLVIITANNLFQLFIGWEGVGVMSFLLIGWWHARTDANTAALQAIIYNRLGDVGLLMTMFWLNINSSWDIQEIFAQTNTMCVTPMLGLMVAAVGKSAQFGFHPWLPAAMEGPTPVSALLHSSTMVVAGVFLILRMHPIIQNNTTILSLCLMIGSITTLLSALTASTQNDIKKIIALSTTSQLGLMMLTLGLNQPMLAFMHMSMHSFFKAMLFLCAGSLIHNLNNEQDVRKMGGLQHLLPTTSSAITTANMALMGTPFLSGFYSKDVIVETITNSHTNAWAMMLTLVATALSATYSIRMMLLVLTNNTKIKQTTNHPESKTMMKPISRLLLGTITGGLLTKLLTTPSTSTLTMPKTIKLAAIMITLASLILTTDTMYLKSLNKQKSTKPTPLTHPTNQFMFFNTIHRMLPSTTLKLSQKYSTELTDAWSLEKLGPSGLAQKNILMTHLTTQQKNLMKTYLSTFTLTTVISLLILSPNWP
uniref:NADH-ubiquinone oxidoreductase chain 5 n=1 Tax=Amerotyphlops reticulatus TaxID=534403 RepID=B3GT26_9SAUR|nr:NADH dehydrogenase subunit 5 [Amerotyphlops reticulatus]ACD85896.1 NADH dehydrogenase subunit 5 [Amerotyphlops reticulatus]